jgi:UDP-N-acetylglucosamine--N-acetylmuramyl-(pentapeptide) pyrophosphoryl-undecaprenol N-acetylglucosamine transferase
MKILIAGGGTGGHLFPGVAVAEELRTRGHAVHFVGTQRGIEARICPAEGWPLHLIRVTGLKGSGFLGLVSGLLKIPSALGESLAILRRELPDLVVGVGGYASGPLVLMAALSGRPTAILEQNSLPGITNRILGRVVGRVYGAFSSAERFFPKGKFRLCGTPVRHKVRARMAGAAAGHQDASARTSLLVVGGSQGAHAVNELVSEAILLLAKRKMAPPLIHQTGSADLERIRKRYRDAQLEAEVCEFIDDMAAAYRTARLVVGRAGASTLAELTTLGLPSVLIPFPLAADDHQTNNAKELAEMGAARLLIQKETTAESLATAIETLFFDGAMIENMGRAARELGRPEAHREIADGLEALVNGRRELASGVSHQ